MRHEPKSDNSLKELISGFSIIEHDYTANQRKVKEMSDDLNMVEVPKRKHVQLFAGIREDSKYAGQIEWAKEEAERYGGYPFPVSVVDDPAGYIFDGGPGGSYRLIDVTLHIEIQGKLTQIR